MPCMDGGRRGASPKKGRQGSDDGGAASGAIPTKPLPYGLELVAGPLAHGYL